MLGLGMSLIRNVRALASFVNHFFRYADSEGNNYIDDNGNYYTDRS